MHLSSARTGTALFLLSLCIAVGPRFAHSQDGLDPTTKAVTAANVGKKPSGQVITFDAQTKKFGDQYKRGLRAGQDVTILVVNPNTVREKYTLSVKGVDFHGNAVPNALVGLVVATKSAVSFADPARVNVTPSLLNNGIQALYQTYVSKYDVYKVKFAQLDPLLPVDVEAIRTAVRNGTTNHDIRKKIIKVLHDASAETDTYEVPINVLVDEPLTGNRVDDTDQFQAVAGNIRVIGESLVKEFTEVDAALRDLQVARSQFLIAYNALAAPSPNDQASKQDVDATFGAASTSIASNSIQSLRNNRQTVRNLYNVITSPLLFPARIFKTVSAGGDSMTLSVQVDQLAAPILAINQVDAKDTLNPLGTPDSSVSSRTFTLTRATYSRLVLDFSAGAVETNLRIRNYFVTPVDTSSTSAKSLREGPSEKANLGTGVLGHLYWTTQAPLGLTAGPCLGVAVTDQTRYLLGISVMASISKQVRIGFSSGRAWGKVNEINNPTATDPLQPLATPTFSSVFRRGSFRALTFNFNF